LIDRNPSCQRTTWLDHLQPRPHHNRIRTSAIFLSVFLAILRVTVPVQGASLPPLRTLTTAHEVHSLSTAEALRGYPIHLRAVVTFYDRFVDPRHIALFVKDVSGSIFISVPFGAVGTLPIGSLVDVQGVSSSGDYAPIIANAKVSLIGRSQIPATAPRMSLEMLATSKEDGQWVEVEGVIHAVFETEHDISIEIALSDGILAATVPREAGASYASLVDAVVRVHGNAAPVFNGNGQLIGARLLVPSLSAITIEGPGQRDPFQLPTRRIESLLRFDPNAALPHRVHLHGQVTLLWLGSSICIRDSSGGLCAQSLQNTPIALGDVADVVGFVASDGSGPTLTDASFVRAGAGSPVVADPITAETALRGKYDSQLIQIDGQLIGHDLAAAGTRLMLASGKFIFAVVLPQRLARAGTDIWRNGSTLRVTGVCSLQEDAAVDVRGSGFVAPKSFRILLRSPEDVVVLQRPSWWTPGHGLLVVTCVLVLTLAALGWVAVLRKRVEQQTSVIRKSEERFRYMAQHDALTGLPTRMLLHDRLNAALRRTKRYNTRLALLMLDLDNFKLVNDSLGHDAGDQTLTIAARRIKAAVRNTDTVARMGGDEFIVLLTDLTDAHEAEMIAAKIVVS
jgi:Diguanylate cyclase, GGDEF domain